MTMSSRGCCELLCAVSCRKICQISLKESSSCISRLSVYFSPVTDAAGQLGRLPAGSPLLVATSSAASGHGAAATIAGGGGAAAGGPGGGRFYDAVLLSYQVRLRSGCRAGPGCGAWKSLQYRYLKASTSLDSSVTWLSCNIACRLVVR
jgi:hypothetical protein